MGPLGPSLGVTVLLLVASAFAGPAAPRDLPNPLERGAWVADTAELIPPDVEARIEARIDAIHAARGVEITVVTVPAVEGTPKVFATELFDLWRVGSAERNDGLMLLLVLDTRQVELEVGLGLEATLSDEQASDLLDAFVVPGIAGGDYGGGLERGVAALDAHLGGARPSAARGNEPSGLAGLVCFGLAGLAAAGSVSVVGAQLWRARAARRCPRCGEELVPVGVDETEQHLSETQREEQRLGAAVFEVRHCPKHEVTRVLRSARHAPTVGGCRYCDARTMVRTEKVLEPPAPGKAGTSEVTDACGVCGHTTTSTRSVPYIPGWVDGSDPSATFQLGGGRKRRRSGGPGSRGVRFGGGRAVAGGAEEHGGGEGADAGEGCEPAGDGGEGADSGGGYEPAGGGGADSGGGYEPAGDGGADAGGGYEPAGDGPRTDS